MAKLISKSSGKKTKQNSLLIGAKELLRKEGFSDTSIILRAGKKPIEPLAYKSKATPKLLQSNRKRRLEAFAMVYAHYLVLENIPAFSAIVRRCADEQGMGRVTRGAIPSPVLRCIMGYKKGAGKIRAKQRQHINTVARAIAHLKQKGTTPGAVATMKPGKGNSIRGWATAYSGAPPKTSAKKNHTVNLPKLGIVAKPGSFVILFGKDRGPNRVEIISNKALGIKGAKKTWQRVKELAHRVNNGQSNAVVPITA